MPYRPKSGATHPERLSRSRCWLVVGTRKRCPRLAQPRPTRGCKVKPVSSWKTTVSRGPSSPSFFYRSLEAARLGGPGLQVRVTGPFQAVAQLVHPHLGLPHLQPNPKLPL